MRIKSLAAGVAALATSATLAHAAATTPGEPSVKVVLVGDSTVSAISGWGPSFCARHVTVEVACVDLARPGRSTASFRREGHWDRALGELSVQGYGGRFVLIQFGHNDQPGKPGHSTDLAREFPQNLRRYVEEARAVGATPVLVTPLTRRQFVHGELQNTLAPWAEAIRQVARETGAPLLDLNRDSARAVQSMGALASTRLAQAPPDPAGRAAAERGEVSGKTSDPPTPVRTYAEVLDRSETVGSMSNLKLVFDQTHLGGEGADFFAAMVTKELAEVVPVLRPDLIP